MRSSSREEIVEDFDALEADFDRALDLSFDALTTPERLAMLEALREDAPSAAGIEHALINQVSEQAARRSWAASSCGIGQPAADQPRRSVSAHS